MTDVVSIHSIAAAARGRMINCLLAGTLLTVAAWVLLWVSSCRNSRTKFAVWFSTLLGIAALCCTACFGAGGATARSAAHIIVPGSWAFAAALAWFAGAAFGLLRIAVGLWRLRRIRRRCVEFKVYGDETAIGRELWPRLEEFRFDRRVLLYVSDDVRVPTAIGFFRPAVLIPAWALNELSSAELNSILLHELGHLRRWDDWTNLAQKVVRALLFFHPAVWWIESRLNLEREIACDDLVVAKTADACGYAQCLVSVAEKSFARSRLALAVAAVSRVRQTAIRLTRILDENRLTDTRVSRPALVTIAAVSLVMLAALPRMPVLVGFNDMRVMQLAKQDASMPVRDYSEPEPLAVQAVAHQDLSRAADVLKAGLRTAELRSPMASNFAAASVTAAARPKSQRQPRVIRASAARDVNSGPSLVRTNWSPAKQRMPKFLFVMRTAEYDVMGSAVVTIRVWHVSFTRDQQQVETESGVLSKSI